MDNYEDNKNASIKEVLKIYSNRLISMNSRTKSYFVTKTHAKTIIDLVNMSKYYANIEGLENFIAGVPNTLRITAKEFNKDEIIKILNNEAITAEEKTIRMKKYIPNIKLKEIEEVLNNSDIAKVEKDIVAKYSEESKKNFLSIKQLISNAKTIEKQYGKSDLYIGYPFIEGSFNDKKSFRAPLVLHPINISESNNSFVIEKSDSSPILNPVFVISYFFENDMKFDQIEFELEDFNTYEQAFTLLTKLKINAKLVSNDIEEFKSMTKAEYMKDYANPTSNEFKISKNVMLGIFPLSSSNIFNELNEMYKKPECVNDTLLHKLITTTDRDFFDDTEKYKSEYKESDIINICSTDLYQGIAVKRALNENLVIEGPPGTGKSQVISNIIANSINTNKKVLVVSEKRVALDVVYNRLGPLQVATMLIHDYKNKDEFYSNVQTAINNVKSTKNIKVEFNDKINIDIDNFFDNINKYYQYISNYKINNVPIKKSIIDMNFRLSENELLAYENFKRIVKDQTIEQILNILKLPEYSKESTRQNELKNNAEIYDSLGALNHMQYNDLSRLIEQIKSLDNELIKQYIVVLFLQKKKIISLNIFNTLLIKLGLIKLNHIEESQDKLAYEIIQNMQLFNEADLKYDSSLDNIMNDIVQTMVKYNISVDESIIHIMNKVVNSKLINNNNDVSRFVDSYDTQYANVLTHIKNKIDNDKEKLRQQFANNIKEIIKIDKSLQSEILRLEDKCNQKRRKNIRQIMSEFHNVLQKICPVIMMTPDMVSTLLPFNKDMFDIVVFDEASQIYMERSIPSIFRGRKLVVAGDSKQLRPSSFFTARYTEDEEFLETLDGLQQDILDEESLLDVTSKKFNKTQLKYHYRCESKELIEFSSRAFYNNSLIFASKRKTLDLPIETIKVEGLWENNTNIVEAEKVVSLVNDILINRKNNETIGVITFNKEQKDLIDDLIEKNMNENMLKELDRVNSNGEDESLFVKNIENVQGDERDIIIFSVAYAFDKNGKIVNQFGPLSLMDGENRLNVAITRGKKKIYIVKSVNANDFKVNENNRGPSLFKKYLQYAEYLTEKNEDLTTTLLNQLCEMDMLNVEQQHMNFEIEQDILSELNSIVDLEKYEIRSKVQVGSFKLDIVIHDKINDEFILGIECDGEAFADKGFDKERDFYRQVYLENRQWDIYRIWSLCWLKDKNKEINNIKKILKI